MRTVYFLHLEKPESEHRYCRECDIYCSVNDWTRHLAYHVYVGSWVDWHDLTCEVCRG